MTVKAFEEYATSEFYKWLHTEIGMDNANLLNPVELAELAWRECERQQIRKIFEMCKPLAHPDLHVIAGALLSDPIITT